MRIEREIVIAAPPRAAWRVLGEHFGRVGEWAAPITASSLEGEPRVGAIRTCHIARFGPVPPGVIRERLIAFDPEAMSATYEVVDGMPSFVVSAINHWSVHDRGDGRCGVRTRAVLELRGAAVLLAPLLRWQMQAGGARVLDELAHWIEHGRPHPRKLATLAAEA